MQELTLLIALKDHEERIAALEEQLKNKSKDLKLILDSLVAVVDMLEAIGAKKSVMKEKGNENERTQDF